MNRRALFQAFGITVATSAVLTSADLAYAGQTGASGKKPAGGDIYARCARACADCKKACEACNKHCQGMAKAGIKGHERSLALSGDCRDACDAAAKIVARKGPLSKAICEACAKACDACGAECKKYPDMAEMAACAKSCAICAKACREMIAAI
jgi:hypothetical protein